MFFWSMRKVARTARRIRAPVTGTGWSRTASILTSVAGAGAPDRGAPTSDESKVAF